MAKLRWAILGTGGIARAFADGLRKCETGELAVVGTRSAEKGEAFASEYGGRAGSYEDAVSSQDVDAVYNALPHHLHEEWTVNTASHGKAVLCEKPFTLDAPSAERALEAVSKAGVFFMEAFMYRCYPQTDHIRKVIAEGTYGRPLHVSSQFGFAAGYPWDNFRSKNMYGGGALMDVGCYCTSMTLLADPDDPIRAHYAYQETPERYDRLGAAILEFPSGLTADFRTAVHHQLENEAVFHFEEAKMVVKQPWFGEGAVEIWNAPGTELKETLEFKLPTHRYALEADTVFANLEGGQAPQMTIEDTRRVMRTLDALRASSGFIFDPIPEDEK